MLVSVILPTYNRAAVVTRAISSVLSQSYSNLELLVIDDGSTDHTATVLSHFMDPRMVVLTNPVNRGVAAARNTGLAQVRGDLIAFLDSDDTWANNKLQVDVAVLSENPHIDAIFSDLTKTDGGLIVHSFMRATAYFKYLIPASPSGRLLQLDPQTLYHCLLKEVPIKMQAMTMRALALRAVGRFDEALLSGEDWEFLIRFCRHHALGYLDLPLTQVNVLSDATHRKHFFEDKYAMLAVLRREQHRLRDDAAGLRASRLGIAGLWCHIGWGWLQRRRPMNALRAFIRGFWETRDCRFLFRALRIFLPGVHRIDMLFRRAS